MNKRFNKKRKPIIVVLDIIIALLSVITVCAGIFAVTSFYDTYNVAYDTEAFYWRLNDEDYAQMVEMYYTNEAAGIDADEELEQYYGVAKYFEAASYYQMYLENGDRVKAAEYQKEMQDAKEDMGELIFVSDKISQKLANK